MNARWGSPGRAQAFVNQREFVGHDVRALQARPIRHPVRLKRRSQPESSATAVKLVAAA